MNELVYLKNDEAVCDSLQVAEKFGKEHKNVLQSIDNLIAENSAVKIMFKISSYKSGNGQSYRKFYMNRDGFSLLAMGFTGREALEWKLQYIRAFNQMENFIREKSTQMWIETRNAEFEFLLVAPLLFFKAIFSTEKINRFKMLLPLIFES